MVAEPLRIGFVGAGFVGQVAHLVNFASLPGCAVVALAETRPELRRQVAARYGIPRTYPTHHELLADREIDAVVAILPRPLTGPVADDVLQAGKPLLTEKPMAATVDQAQQLVTAAVTAGVPHAVGYMRRHDSGVQYARRVITELRQSGELGALTYARSHCFQGNDYCNIDGFVDSGEPRPIPHVDPSWPVAPEWVPEERHAEYAQFVNVYCHNINLLRFLLGDFIDVEFARLQASAGAPTGLVVFDHGGFRSILEGGSMDSQGWHEVTEVFFERGRVTITPPPAFLRNVSARVEVLRAGATDETQTRSSDGSWAFRRQAEAFVRDLTAATTPSANSTDALRDLQWLERIWQQELNSSKSMEEAVTW